MAPSSGSAWSGSARTAPKPAKVDPNKLREIVEVWDDVPKLPRVSLDFANWVANYTLSTPGMVLRMMMSAAAPSIRRRRITACGWLGLRQSG